MSENVTKANKARKKVVKAEEVTQETPVQVEKLREVILRAGETEYKIMVRDHIPALERTLLMGKVESLYFIGDDYDPAYGDLSTLFILARMYTDQTFDDDIDVFEKFATETCLQEHLPTEAIELFGYVQEKVDFLVKKKAVPDEEIEMYKSITAATRGITAAMTSITEYLNQAERAFGGEDKASFNEIASLLRTLGKHDEKKIVDAIIDYQAEKAKRNREAAVGQPIVKKVEKK